MKIGFSKVGKNLLVGIKGVRSKSSMDLKKYKNDADIKDWELRKIAQLVRDKIEDNIHKEKSYKGYKLKAISQEWARRKGTDAILYDTGQLQSSILSGKSGNAYIVKVSDKIYKYPTSSPTGQRLKPPKKRLRISEIAFYNQQTRPFFGITDKDLRKIIIEVFKRRRSSVNRFKYGFG